MAKLFLVIVTVSATLATSVRAETEIEALKSEKQVVYPNSNGNIGGSGFFPGNNRPNGGGGGAVFGPGANNNNNGQYPGSNGNNYPGFGNNVGGGGVFPGGNNNNGRYPTAFSVSRASRNTQQANTRVRFDNVVTNTGSDFNAQTGEFRCSEQGLYVFTWAAVSPKNYDFRLSLTKNGREAGMHAWGEENGYQAGSNTAVLALTYGDRVALRLTEGRVYEPSNTSRGYTSFTGYRIA